MGIKSSDMYKAFRIITGYSKSPLQMLAMLYGIAVHWPEVLNTFRKLKIHYFLHVQQAEE